MRLPQPFVKLPFRVNAAVLTAEVAAIDATAWRPHPEGAPGNTALPLIAAGGNPDDDATQGPMHPTAHLSQLPYVVRVLAALESVIGRTRLMRIEEEGELNLHVDSNYYWWEHLRIHIPVVTSDDVVFECGGEQVHMAAGEVWAFDTWRRHRVSNPAASPRIHLVADTVGSAALWSLIDAPGGVERSVAVDGPPAEIVTEAVNFPVVMSPWEIEHNLATLVEDARANASAGAVDTVAAALTVFRHAWREHWAVHGSSPAGWDGFHNLRLEAQVELDRHASGLQLANGIELAEAIRQVVLRPALTLPATGDLEPPHPPAPTSALTSPRTSVAAPTPTSTQIRRPVFVVSPPRSGSTLLFETLARAPGLFTIGGESHQMIEQFPLLHPDSHDWASNRLTAADASPETVADLHRAFVAELRDRDDVPPPVGAVRLLEKTPKNALRVPFLAAAFTDAMFVSLYRDPRETLSSMMDAWRSRRFITYAALPGWTDPPWSLLLTPGWRDLAGRPIQEIVAAQWSAAVTTLLDDLEALSPERWCVASYDRLVADPAEEIARLCAFCGLDWDVDLSGALPLSRHTLDSPNPEKWRRNAEALEQVWDRVEPVAARAHAVFGAPPRAMPVAAAPSPERTARSAAVEPDDHPPARSSNQPATPGAGTPVAPGAFRSVHAGPLAELLTRLECSLIASTYQTGRLIIVRAEGQTVNTHFRSLREPMGMALRGPLLAIGAKAEVHVFQNQPDVSRHLEPPGCHDACFMPRRSHTTGDVRIHDLAFADAELWAVNTRFSCLTTFDETHSFVPRWRPPFVSALAPEDRCHLNGLAVVDDEPRYVTALGTADEPGGWRENKVHGGVVVDVPSREIVAAELCMPHSPRWHDGRLWVLESGRGTLGVVDLESGRVEDVAQLPGFTRGLSFAGRYAFVGLSQVREHLFAGLPLTAEGNERNSGIWVVDITTGAIVAFLRFEDLVQELFEVTILPGIRFPELVEPGADLVDSSYVVPDASLGDFALGDY